MLNKVKGIAEKLDIDDIEPLEVTVPEIKFNSEDPEQDIIIDYIFIREKLMALIATGEAVLKYTLKDIMLNPGPRTVEGISLLIKTIGEQTDRLLILQEKIKKIRPLSDLTDGDKIKQKEQTLRAKLSDILDEI